MLALCLMLLAIYYAGIMLDAFNYPLCLKLCRHNRWVNGTYIHYYFRALVTHRMYVHIRITVMS